MAEDGLVLERHDGATVKYELVPSNDIKVLFLMGATALIQLGVVWEIKGAIFSITQYLMPYNFSPLMFDVLQ